MPVPKWIIIGHCDYGIRSESMVILHFKGYVQLFIKALNGKTTIVRVPYGSKVKHIKEEINRKQLIYGAVQLDDEDRLHDKNVQNNSTIHLVVRLKGGVVDKSLV